jgi:hypothetical protein
MFNGLRQGQGVYRHFLSPVEHGSVPRMKAYIRIAMTSVLVSLGLAACSSHKTSETRVMTERQRDSTIAASKLPGATVVGKALEQADTAQARANQSLPP